MGTSRSHRRYIQGFAVVAAMAALSACGSATKSSSSSSGPDVSQPASSASAKADSSPEVTAASKIVAEAMVKPTKISLTDPLPSAPPKGKTFVWLNCDVPTCSRIGGGVKDAVTAAGWKYEQINFKSANPATLTAAFQRALTMSPTAVGTSGIGPEAGWSSVIPAYRKAGVPIIASYIGPTKLDDVIIANVAGPAIYDNYGRITAAALTSLSNGKGKALVQRLDAFPILKYVSDQNVAEIKKQCPGCDVSTTLSSSFADLTSNKIVPSIVSALRRDPSIKYVITCDLEFLDALPAALATAGIKVTVLGSDPDLADLGYIKAGKLTMAPTHPTTYAGWVIADTAFRAAMKLPVPAENNGKMPTWLVTKTSDYDPSKLVDYPADYPAQFKALWHLG